MREKHATRNKKKGRLARVKGNDTIEMFKYNEYILIRTVNYLYISNERTLHKRLFMKEQRYIKKLDVSVALRRILV